MGLSDVIMSIFGGQISDLKDDASSLLDGLTEGITQSLETNVIAAADGAKETLLNTLAAGGVEEFTAVGTQILMDIVNGAIEYIPELLNLALNIIITLAQGLTQALPTLIPAVVQLILTLCSWFTDNIGLIIDTGLQLIMGLVQGIVNAMPVFTAQIPTIITNLITTLIEHLPEIISMGVQILVMLIEGLSQAIPSLIAAIPDIVNAIVNAFQQVDWAEIGKDILDGIGKGIKSAAGALGSILKDVGGNIVDGFKSLFGIHSPSTLMRDLIGKNLIAGISVGIDDESPNLEKNFKANMSGVVDGMQAEASSAGARLNLGDNIVSSNYMSANNNAINYSKLGTAITNAFVDAGIGISLDSREFGRVAKNIIVEMG